MKLSLLVMTAGKQEGKVLEVKLQQFLIGRDPQCHLRPASPLISKRHCALIQKEGKAYIRDFGSTNGTFVNNEPVQGERELKNDDQLKVGPIQFMVRIEEVAPTAKTPLPATKGAAAKPAEAKPSASSKTPAPASKPNAGEDDMALEMLMSLDDGSGGTLGSAEVPEGSTVMEIKLPAEAAKGDNKAAGGKPAKPPASGDTRSAAADILSKMTRRPRS